MYVTKRNGLKEEFNLDKIHRVVQNAVDGISDVSPSDIEMNAQLNLYEGITTRSIHTLLIKSANNLISEEFPNYQHVAAKLLLQQLRRDVWGSDAPPRLYEHLKQQVDNGIYDAVITEKYSESEIHKLGKYIKHNRDELYTYAGLQQMVDKYLLKNRSTSVVYETPQFAYMLIAMTCFMNYSNGVRLDLVKRSYDALSTFKINLPTPIMAGIRTRIRQYASCTLFDCGDSLNSIFNTNTAVGYYTAKRAGIGLNVGRIRPINSPIRGGEVTHTGLIPYLKVFESTVKSTSQNGIRGGSATANIPFWHTEIEDVLVLKNNAGTDDNRVRKLDYCIQLNKTFLKRFIEDKNVTLFSPSECPELYETFGSAEWDTLYEKREKDKSLKFRKTIKARDLAELLCRERLETGRIYVMLMDNVNGQNSFTAPIRMTNLCTEILQPTVPLSHIDDTAAEIGVCVLSAVNMLECRRDEYEEVCEIVVRILDFVIDHQEYPVAAAGNFAKNRRSLGVGFTNLAGFLAKSKATYESKEALELVNEYTELLQYSLLKASCKLAQEFGPCSKFSETKYAAGILPIDQSNAEAGKLVNNSTMLDWNSLRDDIKKHGLRHSTLTAQMPCESSSVIQNSTNGIEPVRELISFKKAKTGVLKQVVPGLNKYGKYYTHAFDIKSNTCVTNIAAVMQRWMDQGISLNHWYSYDHYEDGNIPLSQIMKDIIYAFRVGVKTLYYCNTPDGSEEQSCSGGACSI